MNDKVTQQRQLYGEPIADIVGVISARLRLSQAGVAKIIGLSPAMLSQLISGQRIKIGNPLVSSRLQELYRLADEAAHLTQQQLSDRLERIKTSEDRFTTGTHREDTSPVAVASAVRQVLRAIASGRELDQAAELLHDTSPALSQAVRTCGLGSPSEAEHYVQSIRHLF